MSDPIEDILAAAEDPAYVRVVVARIPFVSQELRDRRDRLDTELTAALEFDRRDPGDGIGDVPASLALADQVTEIRAEIEAANREFRFQSIGYKAWADLLLANAPTPEQAKKTPGIEFNPDTFPVAAIAASCSDPTMTPEQVDRLIASPVFDVEAWNELWSACLRANVHEPPGKLLAAGMLRRLSAAFGRQPITTASREASSSAE